ncbi:MAG: alpha-galactosidase [Alphaproteobacteria bacterium]|nr:alpha-galactosidase [Alphaproteobacteria bacterium]
MTERWLYLRGGGAALLVDTRPSGDALPRVVHFGTDLGATPDFEAIAGAAPHVLWGARLDVPCPPCVLPGLEGGYFGTAAIAPSHAQGWAFDGVVRSVDGFTLKFEMQGRLGATVGVDYRLSEQGVLAMRTRASDFPDGLSWIAALALPLPMWAYDVLSFGGDWAREFAAQRQVLQSGALVFESRRGRPGHDRFPGLIVGATGFGDDQGQVFGVTLGWSGSLRMTMERLREGDVVVQAGELFVDGETVENTYESPWAYAAHSSRGLNGLMQRFHSFVRDEIVPDRVAQKARPVHYNTWEAVYFDHDEPTLRSLAERAAAVGVERFVLDDGWFKGRKNDRAGLGDWTPDAIKFPHGLMPLIEHVHGLGLEFGLWVEPEMVNPDSDLARKHPAWLRREADGLLLLQRHQAVLDLGREEVVAHLFEALNELLLAHPINYLKWDMNRDLTGIAHDGVAGHGTYVRALYGLIDRLRAANPRVEIETCASGGGRCDWGMLTRTERVWVSDSNDALDRFDIQRNASLFLPPEVAGAHVGPAACHITGRRLSLDLRAHVAMFGHMGLELDLRTLSEAEGVRLQAHIANYKRFRPLLHSGRVWRFELDGDHGALGVSSPDGGEALVLVVRTGSASLGRAVNVRFPGLIGDVSYRLHAVTPVSPSAEQALSAALRSGELVLTGQVLAGRGLDLYLPRPESSLLIHAQTC